MVDGPTDAGALVGALADPVRRSVFAAVQLGAASPHEVEERTGLTQPQVAKALSKLLDVGVVAVRDRVLVVPDDVFRAAAKVARSRPVAAEYDGLPDEVRKVMSAFVVDGRLTSIPTSHAKRLIILDWLAQLFEPGHRYSEQAVNLALGQRHADTAALRRYLVDEGLLDRADGQYWRSGGTVAPPG